MIEILWEMKNLLACTTSHSFTFGVQPISDCKSNKSHFSPSWTCEQFFVFYFTIRFSFVHYQLINWYISACCITSKFEHWFFLLQFFVFFFQQFDVSLSLTRWFWCGCDVPLRCIFFSVVKFATLIDFQPWRTFINSITSLSEAVEAL